MHQSVFFCFDYQDALDLRAAIINTRWLSDSQRSSEGFFDQSEWAQAVSDGDDAVKELLDSSLIKTTVTLVLIGTDTYSKRWVRYVICKSLSMGKRVIGININKIQLANIEIKEYGMNPFDFLAIKYHQDGKAVDIIEKNKGNWEICKDIKGFTLPKPTSKEKFGKAYKLSKFLVTRNWIEDDGFDNLASWINR
jgi:Thoeris protein ThsB, TIR-like domain